jgi:hypothetical protein
MATKTPTAKRLQTGGRPMLPPGAKKKHPVTVKFAPEELELVNWAARYEGGDRRANWVRRVALMRARRLKERAEGADGQKPPPA